MTTATTTPAPVLTEAQYDELWTMFCTYGRLRDRRGLCWGRSPFDAAAYQDTAAEGDVVRDRFARLLASLTVLGAVSGE